SPFRMKGARVRLNRNRDARFLEQVIDVPVASGGGDDDFPAKVTQLPCGVRKSGVELRRLRQIQQIRFGCADARKNFGQRLKVGHLTRDKFLPRIVLWGKWPAFANTLEEVVARDRAVEIRNQNFPHGV